MVRPAAVNDLDVMQKNYWQSAKYGQKEMDDVNLPVIAK